MRHHRLFGLSTAFCLLTCGASSWAQKLSPTPINAFKKRLADQVGDAWYHSAKANIKDIPVGAVRIALTLSPDGKITELKVLSNTSGPVLERISVAAIRQAQISAVPPELLKDGKYHNEVSFRVFPDEKEPKATGSSRKPKKT